MNYRIIWSLEKAMMGKSGNMNCELDPANQLEVNRGVYLSKRYVAAERDPYIYEAEELGFVARPRRRGAA